jgi:hypothetical protein
LCLGWWDCSQFVKFFYYFVLNFFPQAYVFYYFGTSYYY